MEITEVRIFPRESKDKKLKAYATVTFDDSFVVRDIKIIQGNKGYFVAMPSRKLKESCSKCGQRNAVRSKYCSQCGSNLPVKEQTEVSKEERQSEHKDIAHPINSDFRDYIQTTVLSEYEKTTGDKPEITPGEEAVSSESQEGGEVEEPTSEESA